MKTFLAMYTGAPQVSSAWAKLSDAARRERQQAGIAAWHAWAEQHKDAIVDMGGPLGTTKKVTSSGIADIRNNLVGYTLVRAESQEAAARLFEGHPHFTIFPGDGVEIMECMPVPGG